MPGPAVAAAVRARLLEALVVLYCFTAAAFYSNTPSVFEDPWGLVRLAIPSAAALSGLYACGRFSRGKPRSPHQTVIDLIAALGLAWLSQVALAQIEPEWVLPRWAPTQGGFVGIMLLAIFRSVLSQALEPTWVAERESEELIRKSQKLRRVYLAIAAAACVPGVALLRVPLARLRFSGCLLLAGSIYLAAAASRLTHYRSFLSGVAVWYYACLVPVFVLLVWSGPVYLYWAPLVMLLFAEFNQRLLAGIQMRPAVAR